MIKSNQARHKKGSSLVKRLRFLLLYLNLYTTRVTLHQLKLKFIYNNLTTYKVIININIIKDISNINVIINKIKINNLKDINDITSKINITLILNINDKHDKTEITVKTKITICDTVGAVE